MTGRRLVALWSIMAGLILMAACGAGDGTATGSVASDLPAATVAAPASDNGASDGAVEVLAYTPSQQTGPYYPVEKPADRDSDLVALAGAAGDPAGQVVAFGGTVYDAAGQPLEGITIEIWQTDASGVYDHPRDPGTATRDRNFQFYGEATTGPDGAYAFRTLMPGEYEPRPRHIHVRVRRGDTQLLTTQFYFAGEIDLRGADGLLLIDAQPLVEEDGRTILSGQRDIFLNVGG